MNKIQKRALILAILGLSLSYVLGCFIELSCNPLTWPHDSRIAIGFLFFCVTVLATIIFCVIDD